MKKAMLVCGGAVLAVLFGMVLMNQNARAVLISDPQNSPPAMPINPSPADGANEVRADSVLSWLGGDPDPADTVTYDIIINNQVVAQNYPNPFFKPVLDGWTWYQWKIIARDNHGSVTFGPLWNFYTKYEPGDVNGDRTVNTSDVIFLVNYIFKGGPAPSPLPEVGDVNCSRTITSADIIFLITYVLKSGQPPVYCQ